ncbi:MAG: hypothetical protein FWH10_05285, partial [Oscillospiraceae bacterium]|nr:hypothetical protein [Oscillospiraceae bacterium]
MAETLTQAEIDALLSEFGGDSSPARTVDAGQGIKYKEHDFRNPKFFSKDQLKHISLIYDTYAKHLSQFMSGVLRAECSINIYSVEEQQYFEYSNALPDSIMMGVLDVKPLEGSMLIEIKRDTCYMIIERLLGGDGDAPFVPDDFTDIEERLLERFYSQIIRFIKDSWANVTDMNPKLDRLETNSRLTQIMPIDEIVIIVLMNVKINDHEGSMSVCIPCINLEKILGDAANYAMMSRKRRKDDIDKKRESILEQIKTSELDIRGIL